MQITLVSSGDTFSNVLNRFETNFSLGWVEIKEEFSHLAVSMSESLTAYSIRELKAMNDFLATAFNVTDLDTPKRNSKVSLAGWIAKVLLSAREVAEVSGTIGDPIADSSDSEVEVLEPEEKPVYKISIHPDRNINRKGWGFSEERVSALPPVSHPPSRVNASCRKRFCKNQCLNYPKSKPTTVLKLSKRRKL